MKLVFCRLRVLGLRVLDSVPMRTYASVLRTEEKIRTQLGERRSRAIIVEGDENKRMLKEQSTFSHARLCSHRSSLAWHPSGLLCVLLRRNRWFVSGTPTVDARARTDDVWPFLTEFTRGVGLISYSYMLMSCFHSIIGNTRYRESFHALWTRR